MLSRAVYCNPSYHANVGFRVSSRNRAICCEFSPHRLKTGWERLVRHTKAVVTPLPLSIADHYNQLDRHVRACDACLAHEKHPSDLRILAPWIHKPHGRHRRSSSISGFSFKSGGANPSGGASSPRLRARTTVVKRRSTSLAGSAVAPPSSSELGLLPAATTNVDGFEIAVTGATDASEGFDVTDDSPDRDGSPTGSPPLLVSRRTA